MPYRITHECRQRIDLTRKRQTKKRANKTANFCEVGERKTRGKWQIMEIARRWDLWLGTWYMLKILPGNGARNGTWPGDYLDLILPGNGTINSFWCRLKLHRYFPKEEGMMQHSSGRYFPQIWNQGYRTSRRTKQHNVNSPCTQITATRNPTC